MEQIDYSQEKIESVKDKIQNLITIVAELERDFPDRHFPLDGHLIGSIGEVMAAYYYGIELNISSSKIHDGKVDSRNVQIKITQQDTILISHKPDYLIALYLNKNGTIYEIYNGPGELPWESASKPDSHNYRHMRVNKLLKLDENVAEPDRIVQKHPITKLKTEYKNKKG